VQGNNNNNNTITTTILFLFYLNASALVNTDTVRPGGGETVHTHEEKFLKEEVLSKKD